jgi:hypothetical protein
MPTVEAKITNDAVMDPKATSAARFMSCSPLIDADDERPAAESALDRAIPVIVQQGTGAVNRISS